MKPSVTQADVARAAHVSQMAVSLALRNHPSLPAATRERIAQIAQRLGYRRNPLVAALMRQLHQGHAAGQAISLAYITSFPTRHGWRQRPLWCRFFEGAHHRAQQLGYRLEEFWLREPGMSGRRLSQILRARGISGVIIAPLPNPRGHLSLEWPHFAAATIGYSVWRPALHRAVNHQLHSLALVLRELRRRGYQRIGLALPASADTRADNNWVAGFLLHQHRRPAGATRPLLVARHWSAVVFADWLDQHQPEVVISSEAQVLNWLRGRRDVGFVHLEWNEHTSRCAGIRQNSRLVGAAAVDLVVEQLEHNERGLPAHPKAVLIEGEWINGPTVRNAGARSVPMLVSAP